MSGKSCLIGAFGGANRGKTRISPGIGPGIGANFVGGLKDRYGKLLFNKLAADCRG
jgi:hypothetical protein